MTIPSYTEEDVTLGAIAISRARLSSYTWEKVVAVVLDDLDARGRLVPPGSEVRTARCVHESWSCDHCHDDPPPGHGCPRCGRSPSVPDTESEPS